jgi:tellurite resistance-related uncharacterized protein
MLPSDLVLYRRTPEFTELTVPEGLLRAHSTKAGAWGLSTKAGAWGLIHVLGSRLAYPITDPRRTASEVILAPGRDPGGVEPTILHEVEPLGAVRFFVEFLRARAEPDVLVDVRPAPGGA